MSQLGVLAGSLPVNHINSCRAFEGILLSPCGLLGPQGKLHGIPFTRKQKAENPSAEDGWYMGTRGGQPPSDMLPLPEQLPVAATRSSEENTEWWAVSTSADGSLDVSAILQKTFGTDTCRSIAEPNGFRLASMVSAVSASCGLSCSAIWGASAQQQKLRTCIEQTIAECRQLPPTEQVPPVQTLPAAEAAKPISCDRKQQASPCNRPVSEVRNRGTAQVLVKGSIEGKQPPKAYALPLRACRLTSAFGKRAHTEAKDAPHTGGTLVKLEPKACQDKAVPDIQGADANAHSQGGIAVEQPVLEIQKPSKRLKLMSAVPPRAALTVIKQEETQNICRDAGADNSTKDFTGVCRPQPNSALGDLMKPPQKSRSRRPQYGSTIVLRSRGGKDANVSFHTAAAAPEATANTAQPKALRRLLESMQRSNWGAHRSIKQLNTDCRGHVKYKPQSGYF